MSKLRLILLELGGHGVRRLLLAITPPLVATALPWLLVAVFGGRLPDHVRFVPGWADGPADFLFVAGSVCMLVFLFIQTRRWPAAQRPLVALSWAFSGPFITHSVVNAFSTQWWGLLFAVAAAPMGGVAGWLLADCNMGTPATDVRPLEPGEEVLYVSTTWVPMLTTLAASMFSLSMSLSLINGPWNVFLFLVLALCYLSFAKLRTRIDRRGVSLTLPLLGGKGRLVRFQEIIVAEVALRPQSTHFPVTELGGASGYAGKAGPTLVLYLTDGRQVIVTVDHPWYAANVVNYELHRMKAPPASERRNQFCPQRARGG